MSDRIAVMNGGRVEQLGTPEELYDRPTSRFVADFIGTTNLVTGRVEALEAGMAFVRLATGDPCRVERDSLAVGMPVEISIRPESVSVDDPIDPAADVVPGRVEQVAFLGTTIEYHVRTAGGLQLVARVPKTGTRYTVGSDVALRWAPSEALVLASEPAGQEEIRP